MRSAESDGGVGAFHFTGRIGGKKRQEPARVADARVEPERLAFRLKDDGHAVVNRGNKLVGGCCDDGKGLQRRGVRRGLPFLPNSGKGKRLAIFEGEQKRFFSFASFKFLPFIKSIGGDKASACGERLFEAGLFGERFCAGVDEGFCRRVRFCPTRNQPPSQIFQGSVLVFLHNDGAVLAGGDVMMLANYPIADDEIESAHQHA